MEVQGTCIEGGMDMVVTIHTSNGKIREFEPIRIKRLERDGQKPLQAPCRVCLSETNIIFYLLVDIDSGFYCCDDCLAKLGYLW